MHCEERINIKKKVLSNKILQRVAKVRLFSLSVNLQKLLVKQKSKMYEIINSILNVK